MAGKNVLSMKSVPKTPRYSQEAPAPNRKTLATFPSTTAAERERRKVRQGDRGRTIEASSRGLRGPAVTTEAVMHKARSSFYVCAGFLCLALAYHLGARSAQGQVGGSFVTGSFDPDTDPLVIDSAGQMWMMGRANSPGVRVGPVPLPKPGTVLEATCSVVAGSFDGYVLYADGDAYMFNRTAWVYLGNVAGGTTPATRDTSGGVK